MRDNYMVPFNDLHPIAFQQIIALLLYRLGGSQRFTLEEVNDIKSLIGGISLKVDPRMNKEKDQPLVDITMNGDDSVTMTLRVHTRERMNEIMPNLPMDEEEEEE